jgi:TRAP-type C4-dicarboxylate transport system permease small subunit
MVLLIWVSMLGASIATQDRSHLALEMGEKVWPPGIRHYVKAVAHAVTTCFCLAFFIVSIDMILTMREEGVAISPLAKWFPLWVAYLAIPYAFVAMAIRFLGQAVTTATGTDAPMEERLPT